MGHMHPERALPSLQREIPTGAAAGLSPEGATPSEAKALLSESLHRSPEARARGQLCWERGAGAGGSVRSW